MDYALTTDLVGEGVTILTHNRDEYVAKLLNVSEDTKTLLLGEPRLVLLQEENTVLVPCMFTALTETAVFSATHILAIRQSIPEVANDYEELIGVVTKSPEQMAPQQPQDGRT